MSDGSIPEYLDPYKLADRGARLKGEVPLSNFARLREVLMESTGRVGVDLAFQRDPVSGLAGFDCELQAVLKVQCQRCLQAMPVDVRWSQHYGVVRTLRPGEEDLELIELPEPPLGLYELLEDELLLSLPIVPLHEVGDCAAAVLPVASETPGARPNPFRVLAALKTDSNDQE